MVDIRRMFFGGNTTSGFYSLHDNIIGEDRKKLFILKGMPGGGKSSLMKKIGERMLKEGFTLEYHHCPSDPDSIDSVVINELKIGIVDGTPPHSMDPTYPGLTDKLIDLSQFIDDKKIMKYKDEIVRAKMNNKEAYQKTFAYFKSAKLIYDEIVENNRRNVDFTGVNKEILSLIDEIFVKEVISEGDSGFKKRYMFSNANSPEGFVDYMDTILEGISSIYYIHGDIGTGKSTLIGKIIEEANIRGYNMEIYLNSTIPEKIESLIIKDLNICITSNEKGLDFPHKKVDLNAYFNEKARNQKDYDIYNLLIQEATLELSNARENHGILERCYVPTVDYTGINKTRDRILEEILSYAK